MTWNFLNCWRWDHDFYVLFHASQGSTAVWKANVSGLEKNLYSRLSFGQVPLPFCLPRATLILLILIMILLEGSYNPLSPNSDQHQFSPNNIHTLSREMVMRINDMITCEKYVYFDLLSKSLN